MTHISCCNVCVPACLASSTNTSTDIRTSWACCWSVFLSSWTHMVGSTAEKAAAGTQPRLVRLGCSCGRSAQRARPHELSSHCLAPQVEPQWGSSVAAMPWPPALLRQYIAAAKARGLSVVCDEIMCGLGRHGAEPALGGTGCFLSECAPTMDATHLCALAKHGLPQPRRQR